jgi:hypothetical protein
MFESKSLEEVQYVPEVERVLKDGPEYHAAAGEGLSAEEKRMVRKMDIRIFPILAALYVCCFLDRVNIGG